MAQNYYLVPVREAAVLTTAFVPGTVLGTSGGSLGMQNQLILYVDLTLGSLTGSDVKVEFSNDGQDWYQESYATVASGVETDVPLVHTFTDDGKFRIPIPIKDNYVRISVKGTGTVTGSSAKIGAVVGVV